MVSPTQVGTAATPASAATAGASVGPRVAAAAAPAIVPVASGGLVTASFPGTNRTELFTRLQGAEADGVLNVERGDRYTFDLLAGFRWLELNEGLLIGQADAVNIAATGLSGQPNDVTSTDLVMNLSRQEQFRTRNNFYGGQMAARLEFRRQRLFANFVGKLGLGVMHEDVAINGDTTFAGTLTLTDRAGTTQATPLSGPATGWLAQSTNIGSYSRDRFAVVPETTVRVGYQVTENLSASVGYTFLYCSEVVRPGNQIDPVSGSGHPAFSFRGTDFWAQGIDAQVEFRY